MASGVESATKNIIKTFYQSENSRKAILAVLKSSATLNNRPVQAIWPILMKNLNERQLSHNGVPSTSEIAVYAGIRFFALYQQGKDQFVDGSENVAFFKLLSKLRMDKKIQKGLDQRVRAVLSVNDVTSVINGLTNLIGIINGHNEMHNVRIDFACLAQELYWFQLNHKQRVQVRLKWGEQYFYDSHKSTESGE
ncbi:type I-E CRISPR-associated protein Cse2/CasB [Lactiplantibacillus dongliensis]|uniref:Type I-E CRISPR-associated protein Cse2/CasB n=1 Tax=Lactiplantibacillus dongliensis TaxID=2559919 RepID=A0ABW1R5C5_9LACO|nr:type I-E CRISPR-associated protein Cse2/CasB [Lactiplantibacillus dongliensis]